MTARQQSIPAAFGRRLHREREARQWTLREAAGKCGFADRLHDHADRGRE